jgi:hypothetical protein
MTQIMQSGLRKNYLAVIIVSNFIRLRKSRNDQFYRKNQMRVEKLQCNNFKSKRQKRLQNNTDEIVIEQSKTVTSCVFIEEIVLVRPILGF